MNAASPRNTHSVTADTSEQAVALAVAHGIQVSTVEERQRSGPAAGSCFAVVYVAFGTIPECSACPPATWGVPLREKSPAH